MKWTSDITFDGYKKLLNDGETPPVAQANTNPVLKITPDPTVFTSVQTKKVRVTYIQTQSTRHDANKIVDEFSVTVYPATYKELCKDIVLTLTKMDDINVNVLHAVDENFNTDKTMTVTNAN